jgi:hypothetical protein
MEVRGGKGYIEDFVNARLVRDAHIGVLWEGTTNINALDAIQRAVGKEGAHRELLEALLTGGMRRKYAASALYYSTAAAILAWEGAQPGVDARRLLLADAVVRHYLSPVDPLGEPVEACEPESTRLPLQPDPVPLEVACAAIEQAAG